MRELTIDEVQEVNGAGISVLAIEVLEATMTIGVGILCLPVGAGLVTGGLAVAGAYIAGQVIGQGINSIVGN